MLWVVTDFITAHIVAFAALGASMIMGGVSKLLTKKPNFSSIAHDSLTRSVNVRP
jgi:predicted phage tail protein